MTIFGYFGQQRYARRHLSFSSLKEALDQLPAGFCFATDDGTGLLANLSINAYCQETERKQNLPVRLADKSRQEKKELL